MRCRSDRPCFHRSFQKHRARFSLLVPNQRRQGMKAPSTVKFLTRSPMYHQKFRNGRRRTCSQCRQRQALPLIETLGVLPLLGFQARTVVMIRPAGYEHDKNHKFRRPALIVYIHSSIPSPFALLDPCFYVDGGGWCSALSRCPC